MHRATLGMLHDKSSENCGDTDCLSETDSGTIMVNRNAEQLVCRTEVCYDVFRTEFPFDFDRSCGGGPQI